MYEPSKNTVYIAIAFTSIAALVGACSYWDDISYALCDVVKPELNNGEVRLVDDEGKSYDVTDRIFISSNLEPALKIAGFRVRPQGVEGKFLLTLDLQNKGQSVARDITLRFTGTQAFPLNESNLVNIPNIEKEKAYELSLTM